MQIFPIRMSKQITASNCVGEHYERKLLVRPTVLQNTLLAAIAPRPLPDLRVSMGSKKSQKQGRITSCL